MPGTTDDGVDRAVAAFRDRIEQYGHDEFEDPEAIGAEAADFAVARHSRSREIPRRVGAVYTTDQLARYLAAPGHPLTTEAVRKRAKQHRLVSFVAGEGVWLFPAWQFTEAGGRVAPVQPVIEVWRRLPHGSAMDAVDLAMWLNTRLRSLDRQTPARRAAAWGADDPALTAAVSRLRARAAGSTV